MPELAWRCSLRGVVSRAVALAWLVVLLSAAPVSAQQEADSLERHFEAAQTYQLGADWARAEAEYKQAIAVALQRLGNLRATQGAYEEAIQLLKEAITVAPAYADARVDLAIAYFRQGDATKSLAEAQAVLEKEPDNARARNLLGRNYFFRGEYQAAIEHLQKALVLEPDFETAYVLALAYLKLKKLSETTLLFDEMLVSMGPSPQLRVLFGRAYRETGFYDQAISEFKKALVLDPRARRANYYLGLTYLLQGGTARFPHARQHFEAELALNPDEYFSRFFLGVIYLSQRDYPAALAALDHAAHLRPDNPDPLFYFGQAYLESGQAERAVEVLKKSIELTPDFRHNNYQVARAHYMLGQALLRLGRTTEGRAEITRSQELRGQAFQLDQEQLRGVASEASLARSLEAVQSGQERLDPQNIQLNPVQQEAEQYESRLGEILGHSYHNLGVLEARQQRFAQAAAYFQQAARWLPTLESLDRQWGLACYQAGRYAEATAPLERHLIRNPDDTRARQLLGLSYFMGDNYHKTVEVLRPLLPDLPNDPGLLYAWGVALVRAGEVETGGQIFARLLEQNSSAPEVRLLLGRAYAQQNQHSQALNEFARALELNPRLWGAHYNAGLILLRQGQLDEAAQHFRAELNLNPRDPAAKYHLAYVLLLQQHPTEAIRLLNEVVGEKPDYAEAYYQLGKALLQQGEVKAAIRTLEHAVELDPNQDYSYYQLNLAYRRDGRLEEAERALETYRRLKDKNRNKGVQP